MALRNLNLVPAEATIPMRISAKLRGLGISGFTIENQIDGPIVTGYPIQLPHNVAVSKILALDEDLALACGVESVDIRRVGDRVIVFVPNEDRKVVDFKDALFWYLQDEKVRRMNLPLLLGTDFRGEHAVLELTEQPHVLIAGSTGAGKSVFESNLIASLAMHLNPSELKLYLVDTKRVDLTLFKDLPHVKKTVKDIEDWYETIDDLINMVEVRNVLLEEAGVRNIKEYNAIHVDRMPYVVLVIDELADLLEKDDYARSLLPRNQRGPSAEDKIRRLIQICRASGVHIICCTQRTSTDVISGTIKANFPTRIALKLPTRIDSQVILGQNGAENLLGKGDMLVKSATSDVAERFHGPFVRLEDIEIILSQRDLILQSLKRELESE